MAADVPAKGTVRSIWCDLVAAAVNDARRTQVPAYLTLAGPHGRDIELLIDRNLLTVTELGQIATDEVWKVVAVESSPTAVTALQRRFPGLRILGQNVADLLRGAGATSWPPNSERRWFQALVVNLDLNTPLHCSVEHDQAVFPVVRWIEKIAQLHAERPVLDWRLCLTLNADLPWTEDVAVRVCAFLSENIERDAAFEAACRAHLGERMLGLIRDGAGSEVLSTESSERQLLLMAFVPKRVAHDVRPQGWRVSTEHNLAYAGGVESRSAMVTWVLRFRWDADARDRPDRIARDTLASILQHAGTLGDDGGLPY
jgi:hypothetical protein